MKLALGTTSKNKVRLIKEVLDELHIVGELELYEVSSKVSDQPLTSDETKLGSTNRAIAAISFSNHAELGLGLEVGYDPNQSGDYVFLCWATLIGNDNNQVSVCSEELLLPQFHQEALKQGKYLIEYAKGSNAEAAALIADYRERVIKSAVRMVIEKCLKAS